LLASGLILVVMVLAGTGLAAIRDGHASRGESDSATDQSRGAQTVTPANRTEASETLGQAFREAARRAQPGVVYVQVEQWVTQTRTTRSSRQGDPRGNLRQGSGSGVVFRPDGYILTNNHVIDSADRVTVVLQDRREFSAQVVGRDPNTDVAVIKIDAGNLTVVPIGNSDEIAVGDWVVALGYPLSLGSTATAGIVSAKGRTLNILQQNEEATPGQTLESFIQTDAAINQGNSGGPLVNLDGQVVGISSAIASPTGFFSGYGFAVPINLAHRVAEDLIRFGESHRPRLGVGVADVDPVDAEVYKLPSVSGAEITQVTPGLPAERAGLQLGDVVVAIRGKPVASSGELMEELALAEPGQRVSLGVVRYGKKLDIAVELGAFEPAARASDARQSTPPTGVARLGFTAADLTPDAASTLGLRASTGVVVTDVERGSGAERSLLRPGYLIDSLNGQPVRTYQELQRLAGGFRSGDAVSMVARSSDGVPTIHNFRVRG
jgi:serine protease Do